MDIWHILSWILLGLVAGIIAKFLMPGRAPGGIIMTILLGIAGALVGGFLARHVFKWGGAEGFDIYSIVVAVAGACLLIFAFQFLRKR